MAVPESVRRAVRQRAESRCEYCRMRESWEDSNRYHVEHIRARQHEGSDDAENLALACHHCNLLKGPNLTSVDPDRCDVVKLFHPRTDTWDEHFKLDDGIIVGLTATGRTTVFLLDMNESHRVELRVGYLDEW